MNKELQEKRYGSRQVTLAALCLQLNTCRRQGNRFFGLGFGNETSRNSLNAHMGPNYDRNVAGNVPLSTINQTIQILVPIDYSRLPNYQNKPAYFKQGN